MRFQRSQVKTSAFTLPAITFREKMKQKIPYKWLAMVTVSIGVFMATSGLTVITISLPLITRAMQTDIATVQWVALLYLLTTSSLMINFGRLADMVGRKKVYTWGFAIFGVGSLLCGLTGTIQWLIAFRVIQAIGAAMVIANGNGIIIEAFPIEERGKALGIIGSVVGTSLTVGPSLGGLLVQWFGWRAVFLVNIPTVLIGLLMAKSLLQESEIRAKSRFDFLGAGLLSASIISFNLALSRVPWSVFASATRPILLLAFAVLLASFIAVELHRTFPMMELTIFRDRVFSAALASNFLNHMSMYAVMFLAPFYLIDILKTSAATAGLVMVTLPLAMVLLAPISGWCSDRLGTRLPSSLGMLVIVLGLFSFSTLGSSSSLWEVVLRLGILGVGRGLFQSPNNSAVMGAVDRGKLGLAGGTMAAIRHMGNMTGVTVTVAFFSARLDTYTSQLLAQPDLPASARSSQAFVASFHDAFIGAALISAVGVFTSLIKGGAGKKDNETIVEFGIEK